MIYLDLATKDWKTDGVWKIAPAGLDWIKEGAYIQIGAGSRIGANANEAIDLGWADGCRKCIAHIDDVAWIGAGCHRFTLSDALKHWGAKKDRELTMCLMMAAVQIAGFKNWSHE
jgi:hypothetical protein